MQLRNRFAMKVPGWELDFQAEFVSFGSLWGTAQDFYEGSTANTKHG